MQIRVRIGVHFCWTSTRALRLSIVNYFSILETSVFLVQICECFYLRNYARKIVETYVICVNYIVSVVLTKMIANYVILCLRYAGLYFGVTSIWTQCRGALKEGLISRLLDCDRSSSCSDSCYTDDLMHAPVGS